MRNESAATLPGAVPMMRSPGTVSSASVQITFGSRGGAYSFGVDAGVVIAMQSSHLLTIH